MRPWPPDTLPPSPLALLFGAFLLRAEERDLMTRAEIRDVLTGLAGKAEADKSARSLARLGRSLGVLWMPDDDDLARARRMPTRRGDNGELELLLPDLSPAKDGAIHEWHVAVGDRVQMAQPVAEVILDRATVEVPSPAAGTVTALHAAVGEPIEEGAVLLSIADSPNEG